MFSRRAAFGRLLLVCVTIAVVVGATVMQHHWLALTAGIAIGGPLFLLGMAAGGGLGNARKFEKKPADLNARIGTCLAASGIASASLGYDPPFPLPFRVFYGVCLGFACLAALILSVKALKE
ncbi:MAG: hypothetical protein ACRYFS_10180 [Janthinobacterium lividum]